MSAQPEFVEDLFDVIRTAQNEVCGDMTRLDLHAAIKVWFVNRSSQIDMFQSTRDKGEIGRSRVIGFKALENAPVDLGC